MTLLISLLGAVVQSVAGMGYGMTAVPVYASLFGPASGVVLGNVTGMATSISVGISQWREIDWRRVVFLTLGSLPGMLLALVLLSRLNKNWVDLVIGLTILLLVPLSLLPNSSKQVPDNIPVALTGGLAAGVLSVTVAQSGPAVTAWAQLVRLPQKTFAASMQAFFLFMNLVTIPAKFFSGVVFVSWRVMLWAMLGIVAGTLLGRIVARKVRYTHARILAFVIAIVGGVHISYTALQALL